MVAERNLLRQLHELEREPDRMLAPIVVRVFIFAHSAGSSLPGFSRMSSVMPTLPTSCSALAWRSSSACSAVMPTSRASRSQRRFHPLDVHAGLGVAPLHGHAEPVGDLALRLGEVGGALAHALLEQLVVARHAVPDAALGELAPGDRAERADQQGHERGRNIDDRPVLEEDLGACQESAPPGPSPRPRPREGGASA